MSVLYNYRNYFIYGEDSKNEKSQNEESPFILILPENKYLISINDLKSVNLTPVKNIIPGPSRNMPPFDKVNLRMLNKAQLNAILNVKLKPVIKKEKTIYYPPRHPVLNELHKKFLKN